MCLKTPKNGNVLDNFGNVWAHLGVLLDKFGNVSDYFGSIIAPKNRIFNIKNTENYSFKAQSSPIINHHSSIVHRQFKRLLSFGALD